MSLYSTTYNKTQVELLRPLHDPPNKKTNYQSPVTDRGLYSKPSCHVKTLNPSRSSASSDPELPTAVEASRNEHRGVIFSHFGGLRGEAWDKGMNYSDQAGGQDAGVYGVGFRVLG